MSQKFTAEVGPITRDDLTRIFSDLNTTQVLDSHTWKAGRGYLTLWAGGRVECEAALNRATAGVAADFRITSEGPNL